MSSAPVEAGQVLAGKYRIVRVLGEGGMGVVVEAMDMGLERRVAIKFLLPDFAKNEEATQRFTREARAAVKIQSEHVARVIDVATLETGAPYMVMEFLEGSDLAQVLEANGPLPVEEATLHVIQACEALAEAHAHGIVHRDLKPANLFLAQQAGGSRKTKVLDFGISKIVDATDSKLTRTSTTMGSPLYMSPEQMKSSRDVDLRTDIWALGVILYEALSARPPFEGNSIPEISAQILLEDPKPLEAIDPEIPAELSAVATRALRKQPELRFQNVGDLAMALLPFAPNRARANVERIIRVLKAAGMAEGEFQASLAPQRTGLAPALTLLGPGQRQLEVIQVADAGSPNPPLAQGTLANWGQTHSQRIREAHGNRRLAIAAVASAAAIGGVVALVLASDGPEMGPLEADAEPSTNAEAASPAAMPVDAPKTVGAASSQDEAGERAVEDETALPSDATPDEGETARVATARNDASEPEASAVPGAAEKTTAKTPVPTKRAPRSRSRSRRVTKPKKSTYSGDFKSKFGSRK